MILDDILISSGKTWKKITEGKAAFKLPPEKKGGLSRDAVLPCLWGKAVSFFLWACSRKGDSLQSYGSKIRSFLPLLVSEVSLLPRA